MGTATHSAQANTHAWQATRRADSARLFRAARRHSLLVRFLRFAVPVSVIGGAAAIGLAAWLNPLRALANLPSGTGKLVISGSKLTMELPRLAGFTRDSRAYELTAAAAAQDVTQPTVVELKELRGKIEMQNKTTVELSAHNGVFDTKSDLLKLSDNIVMLMSSGQEGYLSEATVNIRSGHVVSDKPVRMKMPTGNIKANRLEVHNSGEVVVFDGGVVMDITGGSLGSLGGDRRAQQ